MQIVLLGKKRETRLQKILYTYLRAHYPIASFDGQTLLTHGEENPILFLETQRLRTVHSQSCLVILNGKINLSDLRCLPQNVLLFVDAQNKGQLQALSKLKILAVTCGMAEKDTFTFSSVGSQRSVVSLQRQLRFEDEWYEPVEMTVEHPSGFSRYAILIIAALTLFYEKGEKLELNLKEITSHNKKNIDDTTKANAK